MLKKIAKKLYEARKTLVVTFVGLAIVFGALGVKAFVVDVSELYEATKKESAEYTTYAFENECEESSTVLSESSELFASVLRETMTEEVIEPETEETTEEITTARETTTAVQTTKETVVYEEVGQPVYYDVPLEYPMQDMVRMCCKKYNMEPKLVYAVIYIESNYNPNCVYQGNYGLMQINSCNFETYGVDDPLNPTENLTTGIRILGELYVKYGDYHKTLMAYNCGEYGAQKLWNQGTYSTSYSRSVVNKMSEIKEVSREDLMY